MLHWAHVIILWGSDTIVINYLIDGVKAQLILIEVCKSLGEEGMIREKRDWAV